MHGAFSSAVLHVRWKCDLPQDATELMERDSSANPCVLRLIDANLDRAREGLRVVEDWCRFGLEREDLVISLKDWRQRLGRRHLQVYKNARSTSTDTGAGLEHPAQLDRFRPDQVVAANCGRVQEALRVIEEFARVIDAPLAKEASAIRYGLYDLEVTCLQATTGQRRRTRLGDCNLCLITAPAPDLRDKLDAALSSGIAMVQYRSKSGSDRQNLKEAFELQDLCRARGALFIVNDRIDFALALDADGVHLGQDDLPTDVARQLLGPDKLIGRSTHNLDDVAEAQRDGSDYIGIGPVFSTAVKAERKPIGPDLVKKAVGISSLPMFAIGGITASNIQEVIATGCRRVAVIGAVMSAQDPQTAGLKLMQSLTQQTLS